MTEANPETQLISNVIVVGPDRRVLLVKLDPSEDRWWLPGEDLVPYQHPDERARQVLNEIPGLRYELGEMFEVESFRGRRGWHVMFNYRATGNGEPENADRARWFDPAVLPRMQHGTWEKDLIKRALA